MQGRGPEEPAARDDEPDGIELVLNALRELENAPVIDPRDATDPDHVVDVLLDHGHQFDGSRLLYLIMCAQIERFDGLSRTLCEREYLLLDPRGIAEEAVVAVYSGYIEGTRVVPFRSWAHKIVRRVVDRACADPSLAVYRPRVATPAEQLVMQTLAQKANLLEFEARRLIWLSWVERMSIPAIVRRTGVPLERVEWLLASIMEYIRKTVRDLLEGQLPGAPEERGEDDDLLWDGEEEDEEDEDDF